MSYSTITRFGLQMHVLHNAPEARFPFALSFPLPARFTVISRDFGKCGYLSFADLLERISRVFGYEAMKEAAQLSIPLSSVVSWHFVEGMLEVRYA